MKFYRRRSIWVNATMTPTDALAATSREPTTSERRQLAMLAAHVAHEAIKAGDLAEAQAYLADAVAHLRAARGLGAAHDCPVPP